MFGLSIGAPSAAAPGDDAGELPTPANQGLAESMPHARLLFFQPYSSGLPVTEIVRGLERYADYFRAQKLSELSTHYFRKAEDLEKYLQVLDLRGEQRPWLASISVHYMLMKAFRYGYEPVLCAVFDGRTTTRYSVITRRNSSAHSLAELKGKSIALSDVGQDAIEWYNVMLFSNKTDVRDYFSEIVETDSAMSSVSAVIYGQVDAALVLSDVFKRMSKHAAKIWANVEQVHSTDEISTGGVQVWRGAPRWFAEEVTRLLGAEDLRSQPGGAELLDVFRLDGLRPCGWDQYDRTEGELLRRAAVSLTQGEQRELLIQQGAQDVRETIK
ncbi:MAG: PhnD/SsuA/transferrin family substrate-binding protein [Candidatus Schekmanbacteria bacterium]|nr:PhnD/SsuA/transferrin family substrate-binding protein [Candidatus Schekmanbacteria bacterium]